MSPAPLLTSGQVIIPQMGSPQWWQLCKFMILSKYLCTVLICFSVPFSQMGHGSHLLNIEKRWYVVFFSKISKPNLKNMQVWKSLLYYMSIYHLLYLSPLKSLLKAALWQWHTSCQQFKPACCLNVSPEDGFKDVIQSPAGNNSSWECQIDNVFSQCVVSVRSGSKFQENI